MVAIDFRALGETRHRELSIHFRKESESCVHCCTLPPLSFSLSALSVKTIGNFSKDNEIDEMLLETFFF